MRVGASLRAAASPCCSLSAHARITATGRWAGAIDSARGPAVSLAHWTTLPAAVIKTAPRSRMAPDRTARGDVLIWRCATAPLPATSPPPARHRDDTASVARATASCATSPAQSHMMSLRSPRSSRPRPPATCTRDSSHRLAADVRRVHCCWLCACHWDALDSEPHVTTPRHGVSQARAQIGLHMGPRNGLRRPLMKSDLEPELSS